MKPYTPATNIGRKIGGDDIHHRTADQPRSAARAAAKPAKHAARQQGQSDARDGFQASQAEQGEAVRDCVQVGKVKYCAGTEPYKLYEAIRKTQGAGLLRKLMTRLERSWAEVMISHGALIKGRSDAKNGTVAYFLAD